MVYCGKASPGCQGCRTRRIKCDRALPQCTQCVRIRKPCPGYRDQLSLMFRDESTKVMQKAHAQWGVTDASRLGEPSSYSPSSSSSSSSGASPASDAATPPSTSLAPKRRRSGDRKKLTKEICATPVDKAIQFYIEHYVIGLPDEPRFGQELRERKWVHSRQTRDIMAAVGLAGLSNLTGDKEMSTLAKHHYGLALKSVALSIRNVSDLDLEVIMRAMVMMAMYEVVRDKPKDEPASPAQIHIMGSVAVLSAVLPLPKLPRDGPRALLQLCFSMIASIQGSSQYSSPEPNALIPTHASALSGGGSLPGTLLTWISMSTKMVPEPDKPSAELITLVQRFVQLSALIRSQLLVDGQPQTTNIIHQALEIDADLDAWEKSQKEPWLVTEKHAADDSFFPAYAVLDGCYHVYTDMYVARVWNHYRWARIQANQLLVEILDRFPASSAPLVSMEQRQRSLDTNHRLARDTLVSIPSHYRHPALGPAHCEYLDKTKGGAVIGAAGIPTLLFELKVAGCAPGVPRRYRAWALGILETIWADTGMFRAKALAELLRGVVESDVGGTISGEGRAVDVDIKSDGDVKQEDGC